MILSKIIILAGICACFWAIVFGALFQSALVCIGGAVLGVLLTAALLRTPKRKARYYHSSIPPRL